MSPPGSRGRNGFCRLNVIICCTESQHFQLHLIVVGSPICYFPYVPVERATSEPMEPRGAIHLFITPSRSLSPICSHTRSCCPEAPCGTLGRHPPDPPSRPPSWECSGRTGPGHRSLGHQGEACIQTPVVMISRLYSLQDSNNEEELVAFENFKANKADSEFSALPSTRQTPALVGQLLGPTVGKGNFPRRAQGRGWGAW